MFDKNHTGSIDIYEFGDLFNYINQWKSLFESIDRDRSGYIEFSELSQGTGEKNKSFLSFQIFMTRTLPARLIWASFSSSMIILTSGRPFLKPMTGTEVVELSRWN